ncbi:glutamate synthase subunit alpha [Methyloceanibacter superfactus]|uniref:Glutamate synthase [NADPH] large chain n=1 Tax=Methyloceanibacter superfactus TaxID=1774969 RepID=A0A1E3VT01_9HYPH|nr:glutamate synthase large subunit [Methyloceanibacter superfactus]ODR96653.1 glutamate synthase subunit alpha [Methyloceanibacter superfactus]
MAPRALIPGPLTVARPSPPQAQGLYDPAFEHDACGVGFVADLKGRKSHTIIKHGLQILENLTHRGAAGATPRDGDGAGILVQIPHAFFREVCPPLNIKLPEPGHYAVGHMFMPSNQAQRIYCESVVERVVEAEGLKMLGWRTVPTHNACLSPMVVATEPTHRQVFIGRGPGIEDEADFERRLYLLRKVISNTINGETGGRDIGFYTVSLSCRTLVYKGMFLAYQLGAYYQDLHHPAFASALALVHQRFSTNTFPSWKLSHPYRMVAHNGEINTLRGNVNWMAARQASVSSPLFGPDIEKLWPISYEGQSDTACFDNALEFLVQGGYSLAHAAMMLIPEAWAGNPLMDAQRRAFYEYHACLMEPWDGPAAMAFTDGRQIGATLDRNGLRPARYFVTDEGLVVMASETGVLPFPEERIVEKWRLQPGKMLLIDLEKGCIVSDEEIKAELAAAHPYQQWLDRTQIRVHELPGGPATSSGTNVSLLDRQQAFGYTQEVIKFLMVPMAQTGQEAIGSMGTDTPISALSDRPKLLHTYFKQNFAQVTNPPIDPIREELVMSLVTFIGPRPNLLDLEGTSKQKRLEAAHPILTNENLERIRAIGEVADNQFRTVTLDITYPADQGAGGMGRALEKLCQRAEAAVRAGENIIVLSDRATGPDRIPIPSLLATSAVHHHLIRCGLRTSVGLVVETGEACEVNQFCTLAGYGAEAINPYLAFETIEAMLPELDEELTAEEAIKRYMKATDKGMLKVMSKMGISTYQSYCGAQIFDAVALRTDFLAKYFTGTHTQVEGIGLEEVARETVERHRLAFGEAPVLKNALEVGGEYAFRVRGETHAWRPQVVADLQHAVRGQLPEKYRAFAQAINEQSEELLTLRGMFRLRDAEEMGRAPVPLDEVEPAEEIVKRFATGAMSFGSISREAHTTLAIAMNRIGGRSNTGEGGEEVDRFTPLPNGDSMRSAIKQVASGRFGVTTEYLVNSDMMQIKMAQGAKPGEGGQLPGHKVDATIAKVRHSRPAVGLISPPPHHDIYSIEDLKQLIFDLKNVNPTGDVSVKLVSEIGVGTVAAGVAKAMADHVTIAGFEGGTGASPLTSIKHAGSPWEIGLAETQQTLVLNHLRGRIAVQVDGGLRTGRDVVVGALLGATEFGFSTAPLIAAGCIMMRKCHLNTCPVGIATQDPVLRARFNGTPEHVINYFFYVAEEVREHMAALGFRSFAEMIGRTEVLDKSQAIDHWKARGLDFTKLFHKPEVPAGTAIRNTERQDHGLEEVLDTKLIELCREAIEDKKPVKLDLPIRNVDRTAGAMLSGAIAKRYGIAGLPDDTIWIRFKGSAGQSFGAWLAHGVTLDLVGEGNDYVGKGLSGGRIIVRPPAESGIVPEKSIIVGNTVLYGAIGGECYFHGVGGERFGVRNSGAIAVVEGTGDHGCEYMTGGVIAVIGPTGRNFAAGMSGGIAYVLDEDGDFEQRCNMAMVDLEPIPSENQAMEHRRHQGNDLESHGLVDLSDMTRFDEERLHQLIENHLHYTGSKRARDILDNWTEYLPKFIKVMPVEYRRALEEMARQQVADTTGLGEIEIGLRGNGK